MSRFKVAMVPLVVPILIAAMTGCGAGSGPDQHALAEAKEAGYTAGFNAGMDAGKRSANAAARQAALHAFRRGWTEGARGVFGSLEVENDGWYAVKVATGSGTPSLSAGLPMSEDQGYRLCAGDPTELCPVPLVSSATQPSSAPAPTVIVPRSVPPLVPIPNPTPPIVEP
jgi:hypothetical protein